MKKYRGHKITIALLVVLLALVSAALVRQTFFDKDVAPMPNTEKTIVKENNISKEITDITTNNNINLPTTPAPEPIISVQEINNPADSISIDWIPNGESEKTDELKKLLKITEPELDQYTKVVKVGTVTSGIYENNPIYIISSSVYDGPSQNFLTLAIADTKTNRLVIPGKYHNFEIKPSDWTLSISPILKNIWTDKNIDIPDLHTEETITISGSSYTATRSSNPVGFPNDNSSIHKIGRTTGNEPIYDHAELSFNAGEMFSVEKNDIGLRLKNGEYVQYALNIPFFTNDRIPQIIWDDKTDNTVDYQPRVIGGCGAATILDVPASLSITDLTPAGKTRNNETIYTYKNKNHPYLKTAYESWQAWDSGSNMIKPDYAEFIKIRPFFFWEDPFGRIVRWSRVDLVPQAECGKPVVYLYPETTQQVSVKLGGNIEVTKSEPAYNNGWSVTAEPNGTLTTADGKTFPYLYWDGNGASYETPKSGFVIASRNLPMILREKLLQLGLNDNEIKDFSDFWIPYLVKSPYALISFVPQAEWNKAAPLAISPAPETVIRVFMDWKPLSQPIDIPEQILPPKPIRTGFTAVEWGGLLYKN